MSVKKQCIEIGFDKNGEAEFGVSYAICDLSLEQMQELRRIIPVAIGVAEDMFRREMERRNPAVSAVLP